MFRNDFPQSVLSAYMGEHVDHVVLALDYFLFLDADADIGPVSYLLWTAMLVLCRTISDSNVASYLENLCVLLSSLISGREDSQWMDHQETLTHENIISWWFVRIFDVCGQEYFLTNKHFSDEDNKKCLFLRKNWRTIIIIRATWCIRETDDSLQVEWWDRFLIVFTENLSEGYTWQYLCWSGLE